MTTVDYSGGMIISDWYTDNNAANNESIKIISLESGEIINEIKNPYSSHFLKIDIYSDNTLISWSENGMISYWDINTQSIINEMKSLVK